MLVATPLCWYGMPWNFTAADALLVYCFGIAGTVYLDHAGATLYSEEQMAAVAKDLTSNVYGNPRILILEAVFLVRFCFVFPDRYISVQILGAVFFDMLC